MALTNTQVQTIMRGYEEQQLRNRREQMKRVEEVYEKLPQIREMDAQTGPRAAACARRMLEGDGQARERLRRAMAEQRSRREALLLEAGFPVDYMEPRYRCPECRDTGFVQGKRCRCFEEARIQMLYDQSNLRRILEKENFSTLSDRYYDDSRMVPGLDVTERAYMFWAVGECRDFAREFPEKGRNLLFTGGTGVGKTFLTNCIAKELIDRYVSVIYLVSQDFFEILSRYRFNREEQEGTEEAYRYILDCDMLMIDDLGTEMNNTFVSSQLFYCINERIEREKGTIISTNLSMAGLRDRYSDRVTSRIMSDYRLMPLYGSDIRLKKNR
ncbi:MAG: ATP-binding protein [Clostridiales bacterium]|nr:ATP-binding protein [Clostridiales bacterium]